MQFTAPGWYPDPSGDASFRYWDGVQWTNQTQPMPAGQPTIHPTTPLPTVASTQPVAAAKSNRGRWIGGGVAALLVVGAIASAAGKNDAKDAAASSAGTSAPATVTQTVTSAAPKAADAHKPVATRTTHHTVAPKRVTDDGSFTMPNEVGNDLQSAQDDVQRVSGDPVFFSHSHDLLGDRHQFLDSDWQVCTQNVTPGTTASAIEHIDFGVVKAYESCP